MSKAWYCQNCGRMEDDEDKYCPQCVEKRQRVSRFEWFLSDALHKYLQSQGAEIEAYAKRFGLSPRQAEFELRMAGYAPPLRFDYASGSAFGDGATLLCPICGDNYIHCGTAKNIPGNDEYASGRGLKGDYIVIPASCEASWHRWEIEFGFHKGNTRVKVANITEYVDDFGLILASGDERLLEAAITKAKSARFEHGETPE